MKTSASTGEEVVLSTVAFVAKKLSCKEGQLLRKIKAEHLEVTQGVFQLFPGDKGYRIHLDTFFSWLRNPVAPASEHARNMDVVKMFLTAMMPLKTLLASISEELQTRYEFHARSLEAEPRVEGLEAFHLPEEVNGHHDS